MPAYEYKVVPAPTKGLKAKGIKTPEARFSHAIENLMNGLGADGWEYLRADTLPSVERAGLTSTTTEWRNLLVFRRVRENDAEAFKPELLPPPKAEEPPAPVRAEPPMTEPDVAAKVPENPTREDAPKAFANPPAPAENDPISTSPKASEPESISDTLRKFASTRNALKAET